MELFGSWSLKHNLKRFWCNDRNSAHLHRMTIYNLVFGTKTGQTSSVNWCTKSTSNTPATAKECKWPLPASNISPGPKLVQLGAIWCRHYTDRAQQSSHQDDSTNVSWSSSASLFTSSQEGFYFCTLQTSEMIKNTHTVLQNKTTSCYSDGGVGTDM